MRTRIFFCVLALSFLSTSAFWTVRAQSFAGALKGLLTDPGDAVIPTAQVTLANAATGALLKTVSNSQGIFVFPSVLPGNYTLTVEMTGFQQYVQSGIQLTANEIRDLGTVQMSLGEVRQTVRVEDVPTPLQLASSEKSALISGGQLKDLALRGRDFMALTALLPGVVDTSASRNATSNLAINNVYINGGRTEMKNFTIDGVTTVNLGSNQSNSYEPNMDSIAEVRVLTSNYQAEYGRSAAGVISVISKSGGRQFHGSGWWTHRHEEFNANNYFRNLAGLSKPPYRYNIAGFSIGGPAYLPGKFNSDKNKLFFFVSQEYTRQRVDFGTVFVNMPTSLERKGDFSQSFDTSGRLIPVIDPLIRQPFSGNIIPPQRINVLGQNILNFFPQPNFTDPNPALRYSRNYTAAATGENPRRNTMVRIDVNPTSKLNGYFRWTSDHDTQVTPLTFMNFLFNPVGRLADGHGTATHLTYTARPNLVNEFTFGTAWANPPWIPWGSNPAAVSRSVLGNLPQWYPNTPRTDDPLEKIDAGLIPNLAFGGTPVNSPFISIADLGEINPNHTRDITNNLSWIRGPHQFKAGLYLYFTDLLQVESDAWQGRLNFGVDRNNPFDSGHAFANAALGNFNSYTESTQGMAFHNTYYNLEFYLQDNWRVTRNLTLDYGIRFYHLAPQVDEYLSASVFDPVTYVRSQAPRLFYPGFDANQNRIGIDPVSGAAVPAALIGKYVPGTGNPANGMNVGGKNGYPAGLYHVTKLSVAPRFGFAYNIAGKNKTLIRGGWGIFEDRSRQLISGFTANNPPVSYRPTLFYGNLDTFAQSSGFIGPSAIQFVFPDKHAQSPAVMQYSLGIQRQLPYATVLDVAYVGNVGRHLLQTEDLNVIPMFGRFNPANGDATSPGRPLPDDFLRPYAALGSLVAYEFAANSNYSSLQVSARRNFAKNLSFGASYTWSKALGVGSFFNGRVSSYFNARAWNYGPLTFDRPQTFVLNYTYAFPNPGMTMRNKLLSAIADRWTVSGITSLISGAPFTPGLSTTAGTDISGSSEGARITVIGDPKLDKGQKSFFRNFRQEAFALTPVGSFGNAGVGILRGPGINNWDISVAKRIPVGLGEERFLQFRFESYNAFNHTQFSGLDTTARFDPAGRQVNPTFGAFTAARDARVLSLALRFEF